MTSSSETPSHAGRSPPASPATAPSAMKMTSRPAVTTPPSSMNATPREPTLAVSNCRDTASGVTILAPGGATARGRAACDPPACSIAPAPCHARGATIGTTWRPSTGADVDIDRFLATNQPTWDRLAELAARAGRGLDRLGAAELDELVRLYQRATTHLSYAQTYYRDPALTARLSRLAARAGAVLYGTRPRTLRAAGWFLAVTFPAAVWHARRFVLVSAVLTAVPALALGIWIANSPAAVDALGPAAAREAYVNEEFESYYRSEEATQFAAEVFTNNIQVAFLAFAAGVLGCVLTGWLLVANGAALGEVAGLFAAVGQLPRFWGLILPHGLLELTAVFVAGGSGLALGWAWISPGARPRLAALAEEGRRAVVIVLGLVLVFAVAGTIEGYVTGQPWPTWLRVGIGLLAEAAFVVYVVVLGRRAAARGFSGQIGEQERTGWSPEDGYSRPVALTLR